MISWGYLRSSIEIGQKHQTRQSHISARSGRDGNLKGKTLKGECPSDIDKKPQGKYYTRQDNVLDFVGIEDMGMVFPGGSARFVDMNEIRYRERRINNRLPVAREGLPFIIGSLVLTCVFFWIGHLFLVIMAGGLTLFMVFFFRDPDRKGNKEDRAILTPADGRIIGLEEIQGRENPLGEPAVKISVFMSLLSVHVNRIPADGRISKIEYRPGRFFSANLDKASEENENNQITLETDSGVRVVFVQIAGLIARRIVCWVREGDGVRAGQRCGLIRFGSRLDVYLPVGSYVVARVKDRVRAGETILGYLP